ncbi:unnamed protein product [Agarophyton chilense]
MASALRNSAAMSTHLAIHDMFSSILSAVDKRVVQQHNLACNIRAEPWIQASIDSSRVLQIFEPDLVCQSSINIRSAIQQQELHPSLLRDSLHLLSDAANHVKVAAQTSLPSLCRSQHLELFDEYYALSAWNFFQDAQHCRLENAMAYRVNSTLYVHTAVTNHPVHHYVPDLQRAILSEFVDRRFQTLKMVHPRWSDSQNELASTIVQQSEGRAEFASVRMSAEQNTALADALKHNHVIIDLARDAIVPSNIAILALPMIMTLVPVAFVGELSTLATLLYVVLTDLLSTIPFVIKGFELYNSARINRNEMVAYHVGTKENGKIELWVARCTGSDGFQRVGIGFLVFALCTTALGLLLEVYAWNKMRKKRLQSQTQGHPTGAYSPHERPQGPFGELVHDTGLFAQNDKYEMIGYEMDMIGLGTRRRR